MAEVSKVEMIAEPSLAPTVQVMEQATPLVQPTPELTKNPHNTARGVSQHSLWPLQFSSGVILLLGQLAVDPSLLRYPPALISVSNFPASARPQFGLSFSPLVFEMAIGEGMTRFPGCVLWCIPIRGEWSNRRGYLLPGVLLGTGHLPLSGRSVRSALQVCLMKPCAPR